MIFVGVVVVGVGVEGGMGEGWCVWSVKMQTLWAGGGLFSWWRKRIELVK